jgi:hypothetical protein
MIIFDSNTPTPESLESKAHNAMQENFPGNYTVVHHFNSKTLTFTMKLKFESANDETFFLLKYN